MSTTTASVNAEPQEVILATLRVENNGRAGAPRAITIDHLATDGLSFCSDRPLASGTLLHIAIRSTRDEGSMLSVTQCAEHRGQFEVTCQFIRTEQGSISGTMLERLRERNLLIRPPVANADPVEQRRTRRHPTRELGIIAPGDALGASCRTAIPVQLLDVSARGVQLQGRFALDVGDQFTLFMRIGDNPVVMLCRICRIIESADKLRRIGAEFIQVNTKSVDPITVAPEPAERLAA